MMRRRIREMLRKELLQTVREPRMRFFLFGPPIIQLLLFGYAVNLDLENTRIAWFDRDQTPHSRDLRAAFAGSTVFTITEEPLDGGEAQLLLDRGDVQAVIAVLPGFARKLERGEQAAVQVQVEGSNSNTAALVSSYATQITGNFAAQFRLTQERRRLLQSGSSEAVNISLSQAVPLSRVWFNEDLKSRNYFVPGVVVNLIMLITVMLTALAIVREKEIGTMEQLMVTPIRPIELMLGKTLPFALVGLVDLVLMTLAALFIFNVPFRGSGLLLLGCSVLYLLTSLGVGLFISTISHTQQQAMMASFFFFMPAFMLSGFAFPIRNMPVVVQYLTYINPVRYFMEIVRGIFLKGTGVSALWPQMIALLVYGILILGLSALRFHKRLD